MIDADQGVHLWLELINMQAIVRKVMQGMETNKERLMFIKSWRSTKRRARTRLVVATKL
jgi:hypothetical protein